jgi:tRNA threonylcarbamoyladenosine modification (KEOPS) complex  Pcc1 subunit
MAARLNLECEQGATFSRVLVLKDSTDTVIDITGASAQMDVRQQIDSTTTLIQLSTANGRIQIAGSDGELTLTISAADTTDLDTNGVYDLKLTYVSGTVERILEGGFTIDPQVTRA